MDPSDSDDNNDDNDGTGAKDNTCYGEVDGNGYNRGDRNTGAEGGSTERMLFLSPSALSETFGAMAKAKAPSSTKPIKKPKLGKIKNKIARKGKAKNNLSKTAGKKTGVC